MQAKNATLDNKSFSADEGKSQNVDTMLDFNALQYEMMPDLSVATERTKKRHPFQKSEYAPGETAYCILNSGADFINCWDSYLHFKIQPTSSAVIATDKISDQPLFNERGSVLDLIRNITITDRSGNELERVRDVGRLANLLVRNSYSNAWMNTDGIQLGFTPSNMRQHETETVIANESETHVDHSMNKHTMAASGVDWWSPALWYTPDLGDGLAQTTPTLGKSRSFAIPMRFLAGLFDFDQLHPSHLMSGLRIEIEFEIAPKALTFNNVNDSKKYTYTISQPEFVLDSVKLTDSIQRELNERAANDGLEIMFRTWDTTTYTSNSPTSQVHIEVRKAVSRAFGAMALFRRPDSYAGLDEGKVVLTEPTDGKDPVGPAPYQVTVEKNDFNETWPFDYTEWQWRAGNLYFPQQKVAAKPLESTALYAPGHPLMVPLPSFSNPNSTQSDELSPITTTQVETYHMQKSLFGKNSEKNTENDMNIGHYRQGLITTPIATAALSSTAGGYQSNLAIVPLDLERTTVQDFSGIPLNNSRILALDATLKTQRAGIWTIYMQHLKIVRVFMDNSEIEE